MKLSKKVIAAFSAAALLATAAVFTSCSDDEDEAGFFDGDNVSGTNDGTSGKYYRAFTTTSTKHYDATAKITINNAKTRANSSNSANATFGYVFGLKEVTDDVKAENNNTAVKDADGNEIKFYTFGLAGVRYNVSNGQTEWYVSWCEKVPNSVFGYNDSTDFEATLKDYNGNDKKYGSETTIVPASTTDSNGKTVYFEKIDVEPNSDGTLIVNIKSTANSAGGYNITISDEQETEKATATIKGGTADDAVTGLKERTQLKLGRYVTVYSGETASGSIALTDVNGAAVVFEE